MLHNQQSPTWRMITTIPPLLHFLYYVLEDELLKLVKIHTSQNPTYMLTKVVSKEKLSSCLVSVDLQARR